MVGTPTAVAGRLWLSAGDRPSPGLSCSVTAYGPTFHSYPREWRRDYGAGTSCAEGVVVKTVTVSDQLLGPDQHTWYTITGSTVAYGP